MKRRSTRMVGVLVFNDATAKVDAPHNYIAMLGLNEGLQDAGYLLSVVRVGDTHRNSRSLVFEEQLLDAVVVLGPASARTEARIEGLARKVVWVDANRHPSFNSIRRDEHHAAETIAREVVQSGYRRVIYLETRWDGRDIGVHYSAIERRSSVEHVCAEAQIPFEAHYAGSWRYECNFEAQRGLMRPDTAVVCYCYPLAVSLMAQAAQWGMLPGRDFGLACCDSSGVVMESFPELSRVEFDRFRLGTEAAQTVVESLEEDKPVPSKRLRDELVRGTTLGRVG
jgi:DNA-binding LacI/PurR family transcriptional regulator